MRLTFKLVAFEWSMLLPITWLGLIQSIEGLNRTKTDFLQARRNSASRLSLDLGYNSSLSRQLAGLLCRFLTCTSSVMGADSLKLSVYIHIHIRLVPFFWRARSNAVFLFLCLPLSFLVSSNLKILWVEQLHEWMWKPRTPHASFQRRPLANTFCIVLWEPLH